MIDFAVVQRCLTIWQKLCSQTEKLLLAGDSGDATGDENNNDTNDTNDDNDGGRRRVTLSVGELVLGIDEARAAPRSAAKQLAQRDERRRRRARETKQYSAMMQTIKTVRAQTGTTTRRHLQLFQQLVARSKIFARCHERIKIGGQRSQRHDVIL